MSLSLGRRFIGDLLHAGMTVPLVTVQKDMHVSELVDLRCRALPRPSWCSIFTKAYGKVVASRPDLRRAYLSFPWERTYEYTKTSADITMEVNIDGEDVPAFVQIKRPESQPLMEIDRILNECREKPLERMPRLRRALRLARYPRLIRRWLWWMILNSSGKLLSDHFSTFGVTTVSNWGVELICPIAPMISILHYGAVDPHGNVTIRLAFDHRVLDGSGPTKALNQIEELLKVDIANELRTLQRPAEPLPMAS